MNLIFAVRKMPSLIELPLMVSMKCTQCMGFKTACYFKSDIHFHPVNRVSDIKISAFSKTNSSESDVFGTLKKPLEETTKMKNKSRTSIKSEGKKIIKIKSPHKDESNTFGNLSKQNPVWYSVIDETVKEDNDQSDDSVLVKNISKIYRCPKKYLEEMKRLVKEKKIKEALDLFVDMKRNFVTPLHPHYTFMIGTCGRIGYTEMAFKLLRQMTDRTYKPTPATLTGLFNSCAESPFPEYGLNKAKQLKEKIDMKGWEITQPTYHSMIKAFGKCGDFETAFQIVDEMAKAKIKIDSSTFNFLLMSCISNKEAGFTYAVEVWRKMKNKKCRLDIFTCNLLLRAARDCDIGPEEISCLLLKHWSSYFKRPYGFLTKESLKEVPVLKLKSGLESEATGSPQKTEDLHITNEYKENFIGPEMKESKYELSNVFPMQSVAKCSESPVSNLLVARPINGPEVLELVNIKTASDRLALIGGVEGFLHFMFDAKVTPNIKTFTLLLECLPSSTEVEEKLISLIDIYKVKPDIDFFNMLIKRRNFRKDTEAAKGVLLLINKYELTPNIMTFGVLALGCKTLNQASFIIDEMKKLRSCPNIEIMGAMLKNACCQLKFPYMRFTLEIMEKEDIKPNERVLLILEKTLNEARENIILMEQGKEVSKLYQREDLPVEYKKFSNFYEDWSKRMEMELEVHPWTQYKTEIIDRAQPEQFNLSN